MNKILKPKLLYNTESREPHDQARMVGGNPDGLVNINGTNHTFAGVIYKNMKKRSWFVGQVSLVKDKINYIKLSDDYRHSYDRLLAQLITNDSIQINQLMDSINKYLTSPVTNLCLAVQTMEEGTHVESYTVMADEIVNDTFRIYNLQHEDSELMYKNSQVAEMYSKVYSGDNPTVNDVLIACAANQILEELVFPGGFVGLLIIGETMPGTKELIQEIFKDETLSHVPLFKGIFRTIVKEEYDNILPITVHNAILEMVMRMCEVEKRWSKHALKGLVGASDIAIDRLAETQANSVCSNLHIDLPYQVHNVSPLNDILTKNLKGGSLSSRSNFFTGNVAEYEKVIDIDF